MHVQSTLVISTSSGPYKNVEISECRLYMYLLLMFYTLMTNKVYPNSVDLLDTKLGCFEMMHYTYQPYRLLSTYIYRTAHYHIKA